MGFLVGGLGVKEMKELWAMGAADGIIMGLSPGKVETLNNSTRKSQVSGPHRLGLYLQASVWE